MIRWDLLKIACEDRIKVYKDAVESSEMFGAINTQRKYLRLIARYQRLLFFIDQRTAIVKPKTAQI
jgi:hypothetical protein